MTTFDDAYRAAQAAARVPKPVVPPQPDPNAQWTALAQRVDTEVIARFLRSKHTRAARRAGTRGSASDSTWRIGVGFSSIVSLRIESHGCWDASYGFGGQTGDGWRGRANLARPSAPNLQLFPAVGSCTGVADHTPTPDEVFTTIQQEVANYMVSNGIRLR